jgi:hypothetical protein
MTVRYAIKLKNAPLAECRVFEGGCFGGLHNLQSMLSWGTGNEGVTATDVESIIYVSDMSLVQCGEETRNEFHDALFEHTIVGKYFTELESDELVELCSASHRRNNSSIRIDGLRAYKVDPTELTADELMFMMFTLRIVNLETDVMRYGWNSNKTPENLEVRLMEAVLQNNYYNWSSNCSEYSTITRNRLTPSYLIRAIRTFLLDDKFGITVKGRQQSLVDRNGYSRSQGVEVCRLLHGVNHRDEVLNRSSRPIFQSGSSYTEIERRRTILVDYIAEAKKTRKVRKGLVSALALASNDTLATLVKHGYTTPLEQGRALASAINASR